MLIRVRAHARATAGADGLPEWVLARSGYWRAPSARSLEEREQADQDDVTTIRVEPLTRVVGAYADVIRTRSYFPLWLGQLLSSFGDTLHYIALVVLVFQLTGQGIAVAALAAAEILPILLLGPVAGVVIDRFSRKAVLIGADLFRALLVLSLLWPQGAWGRSPGWRSRTLAALHALSTGPSRCLPRESSARPSPRGTKGSPRGQRGAAVSP